MTESRHRTDSPEFERMNANGFAGIHGDDLRIAAELEAIGSRLEPPPHVLEDHELHPPAQSCPRCGRMFADKDECRRRADGLLVHLTCGPAQQN
jgi:hypothetical protein